MERSAAIGRINEMWPATVKGPSKDQIEFLGRLADLVVEAYQAGHVDGWQDNEQAREELDEDVPTLGVDVVLPEQARYLGSTQEYLDTLPPRDED
jgi:hypothetical protein